MLLPLYWSPNSRNRRHQSRKSPKRRKWKRQNRRRHPKLALGASMRGFQKTHMPHCRRHRQRTPLGAQLLQRAPKYPLCPTTGEKSPPAAPHPASHRLSARPAVEVPRPTTGASAAALKDRLGAESRRHRSALCYNAGPCRCRYPVYVAITEARSIASRATVRPCDAPNAATAGRTGHLARHRTGASGAAASPEIGRGKNRGASAPIFDDTLNDPVADLFNTAS